MNKRYLIIGSIFIVIIALVIASINLFFKRDEKMDNSINSSANNASVQGTSSSSRSDGLIISDITVGTGKEAKTGDTVKMHYLGTLEDGTKFDSSYDRGQPFTTQIGVGQVIKGWDEGVPGMKVGGKRKLTIPYQLAYGEQGYGPIPPKATLIFEMELVDII